MYALYDAPLPPNKCLDCVWQVIAESAVRVPARICQMQSFPVALEERLYHQTKLQDERLAEAVKK